MKILAWIVWRKAELLLRVRNFSIKHLRGSLKEQLLDQIEKARDMATTDELISHISAVLQPLGVELDDLTLSKAGSRRVLDVVVDADDAIDLDRLAEISRAVSESLDESDIMGTAPYVMEVGTRGVGRPLTKPAHWRRNVGRLVKISGDAVNASGRIVSFDEPTVVINIKGQPRKFDISTISRAVIEVEFSRQGDDK